MVTQKSVNLTKKVDFRYFGPLGATLGHIGQQVLTRMMLTKIFLSEKSLQSDRKMYLHRSHISNIRELTTRNALRCSAR